LRVLENKSWTNKFFSMWFSNMDNFRRVHDKKLSIAAISALLTLGADQVPTSVQTGWPRLLTGVTQLFRTLPAAMKLREEAVRANDGAEDDDDEYDDEDDEEEQEDWAGAEETEWGNIRTADVEDVGGDIKDESQSYLDFLNEEAKKFGALADDDEDSELDEDNLLETPLDKFEPYIVFRDSLLRLQQEQMPLYESLTKVLDSSEQQILQGVIHEAEARSVAAQQAQAQVQMAAPAQNNATSTLPGS